MLKEIIIKTFIVFLVFLSTQNVLFGNSHNRCDRKPQGATGVKSDPETKFRILIHKSPTNYKTGQTYTVILQGTHNVKDLSPFRFNGFSLVVQLADFVESNSSSHSPHSAGIFQLTNDMNARIDEKCPNMVVHRSHAFVPKIEVNWQAPLPGAGCVLFKAAVMEQNVWYMDDRGLTLKLCEDTNVEQFPTLDTCCACYEAKYEMRFEGLWTRQSHPKGFPQNIWLTRFSDVIGVSHTVDYRFWRPNETASDGLVNFCETDNSTDLESEIKRNGTRTVIKAKGIAYPNITGKTFAVFRVDPEHHLLSVVSMIRPSPDWFVGISGLELCDENCMWIQKRELELFPWDLGVYNDVEFNSRNLRNEQLERIYRIDPLHPNDTNSPFYDPTGEEIKPMAKLYLTFQKQYETNCSSTDNNFISVGDESILKDCQFTEWTNDGNCDCASKRIRSFRKELSGVRECNNPEFLSKMEDCSCQTEKPECSKHKKWSSWSSCSKSQPACGENVKFRFLDSIESESSKDCNVTLTQEVFICNKSTEECPLGTNYLDLERRCAMLNWSTFSPCDKNCRSERTRRFVGTRTKDLSCEDLASRQIVECGDCKKFGNKLKSIWKKKLRKRFHRFNVTITSVHQYEAQLNKSCGPRDSE